MVDVGPEAVTFSCVSAPDRLQALEELMEPYGIRELVRTGQDRASTVTASSEKRQANARRHIETPMTTIYYESDCDPSAPSAARRSR